MSYVTFIAGSSNTELAQAIARCLNIQPASVSIQKLPEGECLVDVQQDLSGQCVVIVQSLAPDPSYHLIELLLTIEAVKRNGAKAIIVVCPYFAFCRQTGGFRKAGKGLKLFADLLSGAGVDQVILMDPHLEMTSALFEAPIEVLTARNALISSFQEKVSLTKDSLSEWVVVGPDLGSAKLASSYAIDLGLDMALIQKKRVSPSQVEHRAMLGEVEGKNVLLADDICSTAGTLASAAKACHEKGAKRIVAMVTHGLFVLDSLSLLQNSPIEAVFVSNTVSQSARLRQFPKVHPVCVSHLFAAAISLHSSRYC